MMKRPDHGLALAAERASSRPYFLGYALRLYQKVYGMGEEELAGFLGCDLAVIPRLGLCRQPGIAQYSIAEDIAVLERRFGIDPGALAAIVEEGREQIGLSNPARETHEVNIGPLLRRYAEAEGLSWDDLAEELRCSRTVLDRVALHRQPREEHFVEDVREIADEGVDFGRLLPLLRLLQALRVFKEHGVAAKLSDSSQDPLLLAARDRQEGDDEL